MEEKIMIVSVKLKGLLKEPGSRHEIDHGEGWAEWRALKLIDSMTNKTIAEWFYVVACNKHYLENNVRLKGQESSNTFLFQDQFNETELIDFINDKLSQLHFNDWDDFYNKMSTEFIYEDSDD